MLLCVIAAIQPSGATDKDKDKEKVEVAEEEEEG